MRVVFAVLRYLPALGGSTRVVQLLAEGVADRGHSVTVVTQEEPDAPAREEIGGVTVLRLGMRHVDGFRIPKGYLRSLRALDADVFHLHGNRIWCADYYFPFVGSFDWPQVITPHGFYHYWMRGGFVRWLYYERYFPGRIRKFDRYIALTEAERGQVLRWRLPPDRVALIPNGIDLVEFDRPTVRTEEVRAAWGLPVRYVGVYAGGLFDNKRVDRLIRAVAATGGKWGLVVIGPDVPGNPYDLAHCRRLADRLSAPVRFLGPIDRASLRDALFAADAYVQGSAFEGFGIGLLEGMAAGRPFVAFDAGAARELSATGAGFCVTSEGEMARRLDELSGRLEEMGRTARDAVRAWSSERMVDRHLALYRSITRGDGSGPLLAPSEERTAVVAGRGSA